MQPSQYWHQPNIDPVLLHLWGPFQIRWYSLLYVGGFLIASFIGRHLSRQDRFEILPEQFDRFVGWLLVGAVIGARLLYCIVYDPWNLFQNPLYLFQIYKGGLSFHGGLIGLILAMYLFARRNGLRFWNLADLVALCAPIGLAMGRIGNFINGELFGRPTNVPWAVIFKDGGPIPRHPSQLYECALEGIGLFLLLWLLKGSLKKDGQIAMVFLFGYSIVRFIVEFFREPDPQLGYLLFGLTMGQILSLIMAIGATIILYRRSK